MFDAMSRQYSTDLVTIEEAYHDLAKRQNSTKSVNPYHRAS